MSELSIDEKILLEAICSQRVLSFVVITPENLIHAAALVRAELATSRYDDIGLILRPTVKAFERAQILGLIELTVDEDDRRFRPTGKLAAEVEGRGK